MNQVESMKVTIEVLDQLIRMLAENGETDLIPALILANGLLRQMQDASLANPAEFPEFAVPTQPPEPSPN